MTNLEQLPPFLKRAGLPPVRFHDLRHTAATLLLSQTVNPLVVSQMLGHADIAITLGIYGHVTSDMQREAAEVVRRVFESRPQACTRFATLSARTPSYPNEERIM